VDDVRLLHAGASDQPWLWSQRWLDLLFAHWRVPVAALRPHIPVDLEIDTRDGAAWVSVVAFRLDRVRRRWLPPVWPASAFAELNLRTYVHHRGEPGICFLSIHAGQWLATHLARFFTPLPYVHAPIRFRHPSSGHHFNCPNVGFAAAWTPEGPCVEAGRGSLDAWLLERYVLFVGGDRGALLRTSVAHPRWAVQRAQLTISTGTLGAPFGLDLREMPDVVHCSSGVRALVWPFAAVASSETKKGGIYFPSRRSEARSAE
jgi:uncharacterized protein